MPNVVAVLTAIPVFELDRRAVASLRRRLVLDPTREVPGVPDGGTSTGHEQGRDQRGEQVRTTVHGKRMMETRQLIKAAGAENKKPAVRLGRRVFKQRSGQGWRALAIPARWKRQWRPHFRTRQCRWSRSWVWRFMIGGMDSSFVPADITDSSGGRSSSALRWWR